MAGFSYTLAAGSLTITRSMGLKSIAIKLVSGTGSIVGTAKLPDGTGGLLSSTPIILIANDPITITTDPVVDGWVITADAASVIQILGDPQNP